MASLIPSSAVSALNGLVTLDLEHVAHELSVLLVVFDDEDQFASHLILPRPQRCRYTFAHLRGITVSFYRTKLALRYRTSKWKVV